jgi:hypothetical protein
VRYGFADIERDEEIMNRAGLVFLAFVGSWLFALASWWGVLVVVDGSWPTSTRELSFVLIISSIWAVPIATYIAISDSIAREFTLPASVTIFLLLAIVGVAILAAVFHSISPSRFYIQWSNWIDFKRSIFFPSICVAAIFLLKRILFSRRRGR